MTEGIIAALTKVVSLAGLKILLTTIIVYIEYMIGGFDLVMRGLLMLMILDFAMGFTKAARRHEWSRRKMTAGIYKFILYAVTIMTGHWTDIIVFHSEVQFGLQNVFIVYLGLTEALSILKHASDMGVPVPRQVIVRLESYRNNINIKDPANP